MNAWSTIIPGKQCPTCYGPFFGDEIAVYADLRTENAQNVRKHKPDPFHVQVGP